MSLALVVATLAGGLLIRFGPLGLPRLLVKFGGSALWALMIYWIVSTLRPGWRPAETALLAGSVATAVEFLKLFHTPGLDAFRLTLPGVLLLGRFFSVLDIVVYWIAILLGALADLELRGRLQG